MQVLMIDDNEDDYLLVRHNIAKISDVQIEWRDTVDEGLAYLEAHSVDLLLLDLSLSDGYGLPLLDRVQTRFPAVPIIILSGNDADELAFEAIRHGAQDYLVKGQVDGVTLGRALRYAVERKRLEERLRQSEELYRAVARNFPNGALILYDHDLRYTLIDGLGMSDIGLSKEGMEGKTIWEFLPAEAAPAAEKRLRSVLTGKTFQQEINYPGQTLQVSYVPIRDGSGNVVAGMMMTQNITQLKGAEERFRSLLESAPDAMVIVNQDGNIDLVNSQTVSMFGYSGDELIGKSVEALVPESFRTRHPEHRVGYIRDPRVREMGKGLELYGLRKDGSQFPVEISLSPIETEDGTLIASAIRDITERKQVEEALRTSEEQFRSSFNNAAIGMALVALDGGWLQVNRALCGILGYSEQELMTKTFQDITHPDDLDLDLRHVAQVLAGEIESYQMEKRYFHKAGHEVWALLSVSLVRDSQGQPLHFISQIQDITQRKVAEAALASEHNLLRTLIDHLPDYVFVKDMAGRFVVSNEAHTRSSGKTIEEIIGKTSLEVFPQKLADQYYADDLAVIQSGQPLINAERRTPDPEGHETWGLTTKVPFRDPNGQVVGLIGITRDITERKQAEAQARELVNERERVHILSNFVRDTSHDFRTPLSTINTSLYILSKSTDPERRKTSLSTAEAQIGRLTHLIDRLLVMARLDSETAFALQRVDLNRLVDGFGAQLSFEAKRKPVTVVTALCEGSLMVQANSRELHLALAELGKNAVWYTPAEGTITVRTRREDQQAVIEVCDTGIGIPSEEFAQIFQRLYRVDKARSAETGGAGLGLSIARRIIELHAGEIRVESVVGQGSTFRVCLPISE